MADISSGAPLKFFNGPLQNFDTTKTIPNGIYFAKDAVQSVGLIFNNGKWYGADTLDLVWDPSSKNLSWYNFDPDTKEYIPCTVDFSGVSGNYDELSNDVSIIKNLLFNDKEGVDASVIDTWNEVVEFLKGVTAGEISLPEELDNINTSIVDIKNTIGDISALNASTIVEAINNIQSNATNVWVDLDGNAIEHF